MKALKLSQVFSILALAFVASIVPACNLPEGSSLRAASFQTGPSGPTIHQATAAGTYSVPVTGSVLGTTVPLTNWTFTAAPGEVVTRVVVSGTTKFVYPGYGPNPGDQATIAVSITDGHGVLAGISPYVPLQVNTTGKPFYADMIPNLSGIRTPATFPTITPYTISLVAFTYPYWTGDFTNLQVEVYTAPFVTVSNSPQIN